MLTFNKLQTINNINKKKFNTNQRSSQQTSRNFGSNSDNFKFFKQNSAISTFNKVPIFESKKTKVLNKLYFYKKLTKHDNKKKNLLKQLNNIKCEKMLKLDDKTKLQLNNIIENKKDKKQKEDFIGSELNQKNNEKNFNDKTSINPITKTLNLSLTDKDQYLPNNNNDTNIQSTLIHVKPQIKTKKYSENYKLSIAKKYNPIPAENNNNLLSNSTQFSKINPSDDNNNFCINTLNDDNNNKLSDTIIRLIFKEISTDSLVTFL